MPRTFDPGTFDIHEFEDQKPEVFPLSKGEKINPKTLKGIKGKARPGKEKKTVFLAVVGNLLLPGLGNVLLKKTFFSGTLLLANIFLLVITLSPNSILGFIGNVVYPRTPVGFYSAYIVPAESLTGMALKPELTPAIFLVAVFTVLAWLHLLYLLASRK